MNVIVMEKQKMLNYKHKNTFSVTLLLNILFLKLQIKRFNML